MVASSVSVLFVTILFMENEKSFSTNPELPSQSEKDVQSEQDWATYGQFVPAELRFAADYLLNLTGRSINCLGDLDTPEKQVALAGLLKRWNAEDKTAAEASQIKQEFKKLVR